MSKCIDPRPMMVCFQPANGSDSVELIEHILYEDWVAVGQWYTTVDNVSTMIDISTFLWGGTISWLCDKPVKESLTVIDYMSNSNESTEGWPNSHDELVAAWYTIDVEAVPVATEPNVFLGVAHKTHQQPYYTGNGSFWETDVHMRVGLPSSFIQRSELVNLPTVSIVDYNANGNLWWNGQDEDPQALASAGYTKDIEALPIAVPAWESLPVKIGMGQNTYYAGNNTIRQGASIRVSLNESAVVRTETVPQTITVATYNDNNVDYLDDDTQILVDQWYSQDVEAQSVATLPWVYLWVAHKTHQQEYYAGAGSTSTAPVHMRVAFPSSAVIKTEEQESTVLPWGLSIAWTAVTTPPVTTVRTLTVTKESGNFVEVSFDSWASYPLRINRNGTRTFGAGIDELDVSAMRFRGWNANTDYDLIRETV